VEAAQVKRNQSLDVLRAVAVVLVLGCHSDYYPMWTRFGWVGVDLFFVLSGFLISGLLFEEYKNTGAIRASRFLLRRGLKIWPSYYLLLCAATIIYFYDKSLMTKGQLLSTLFVVQNYLPGNPNYLILSHTWTLAVEEHFYLMLPFLLIALIALRKRNPFEVIPWLATFIAVACLLSRFRLDHWNLPDHLAWPTHMRIDGLFGGVTLGYLYHFKSKAFATLTSNYFLALAAILISPALLVEQADPRMQTYGLTIIALGFIFLVAWAVSRTPHRLLRPAARLGVYSYSIYLWHTAVVDVFLLHRPTTFFKFWLYMATSIGAGSAMAYLVEIPYLKLRDRLFPSAVTSEGWASTRNNAAPAPGTFPISTARARGGANG
jgi:peptidoglycan/LPS O-acetylase OafA/YrhL